jgi:ATP-binding cassette subfamily C (CFTR/MRP) protein 1
MRLQPQSVGTISIRLMIDLETDAKIQQTIHTEFEGKTLLCIAHRLRTIISWDRILVMSAGEIEVCDILDTANIKEFDTPIVLFDKDGLFRSMCDRSGIARQDILKARRDSV